MSDWPVPASVRSIADVAVGDLLPQLSVTVTEVTNFMFGAAFWAAHRLHYDVDLARTEGFESPLVSGALMSGYASRLLVEWAGHPHAVRRVTSRNLSSAFVGDTLDIAGSVTAIDPSGRVDCTLTLASGDRRFMACDAQLQLRTDRA